MSSERILLKEIPPGCLIFLSSSLEFHHNLTVAGIHLQIPKS